MNSKRFAEIYEGLTSKEAALFGIKKDQYAFDDERLHNFIQAAKVEGRRPSQIAFTYFVKHLIAIQRAIDTEQYELYWERLTESGDKDECIVQRFADARNYLLLMLCCLEYEAGQPVSFETKAAQGELSEADREILESFLPEIEAALVQRTAPTQTGVRPSGRTQYEPVPEEAD